MRKITLFYFLAFVLLPLGLLAQKQGYKIKIQFPAKKNAQFYLATYYGRANTVYKKDSVLLDAKGGGVLEKDTPITGGLYMLLEKSTNKHSEFVLNNGDELEIKSKTANFEHDMVVSGSEDNKIFAEYKTFLRDFDKETKAKEKKLAEAKDARDSSMARIMLQEQFDKLKAYRSQTSQMYPDAMLASVFQMLEEPDVPPGPHFKEDGTTVDSGFAYRYFKQHYWDAFPFSDDRVIYSPIYHEKIDKYFKKILVPNPDTIAAKGMWLLEKTAQSPELFKYTMWYINRFIWQSEIMGMQQAIIPIAEEYYNDRSTVFWLEKDEDYDKMMKKILVMKPSIVGNMAHNLPLENRQGQAVNLLEVPGDYLMVVFWAPDCGQCRKELPRIDSFFDASLKKRGDIKLVAIKTEGDSSVYDKFIADKGLEKNWTHLNDDKRQSNFRYWYDVEATPTLFMLNPERKIIGKRFNFEDAEKIIEFDKKNQ